MKWHLNLLLLLLLAACAGGSINSPSDSSSTDDNTSSCCGGTTNDNDNADTACAAESTWTSQAVSLQNNQLTFTNNPQISLILEATNSAREIEYYHITETSTPPNTDSPDWISVSATNSLFLQVTYTLSSSDGLKNIYAWFKDTCNNISPVITPPVQVTKDTTPPTVQISLDHGTKFTLESDPQVNVSLSANDTSSYVSAYYLSATLSEPNIEHLGWVKIATDSNTATLEIPFNLPQPLSGKTNVYSWVKDTAGNISLVHSDDIEVMFLHQIYLPNSQIGQYTSIAIDSMDSPYISNYDFEFGELAATYFVGTSVAFASVDPLHGIEGDYGKGTSIAIDANDDIHIAYRDEVNDDLKYATNASGSWVRETIDDGGGTPNIEIDSLGFIHIVHQDETLIKYVTNQSGSWVTTILFTDIAGYNYLQESLRFTLDPENHVHALYVSLNPFGLYHFSNETGSWVTEVIYGPTEDMYPSPAINMNGDTLIAAYTRENGLLYYAEKPKGGQWAESEPLDFTYKASLAADSKGFVHMCYRYNRDSNLKYASNITGDWQTMVIDNSADVGDFCDIAIDSQDRIHISYFDATNADLKYATTQDKQAQ